MNRCGKLIEPLTGIVRCQVCSTEFNSDERIPEHKFMDGKDHIVRCSKCYREAYKNWKGLSI